MAKKVPRAGLIPFVIENGELLMLMMQPSDADYGGDKFQIAKGKVEEGETSNQAAVREASEELGLVPSNLRNLEYLGKFLGYTDIFYGEIEDKNNFGETTYETGATKWMTIEEFLSSGRGLHKPIIKAFQRAISYEPSLRTRLSGK
jgi:8-oxo-dGTP pyrophosphatase MutT (NUDIX family)